MQVQLTLPFHNQLHARQADLQPSGHNRFIIVALSLDSMITLEKCSYTLTEQHNQKRRGNRRRVFAVSSSFVELSLLTVSLSASAFLPEPQAVNAVPHGISFKANVLSLFSIECFLFFVQSVAPMISSAFYIVNVYFYPMI